MSTTLLTPGPVPLAPEVCTALNRPLLHHRTPEFEQIFTRLLTNLKFIFQTQSHCCAMTCSGTGVMEAALVNAFAPGQNILAICAGKFGERWAEMAELFGLNVTRLNIPWGQDLNLNEFISALQHKTFHGVLVQACETSTGALLPIFEISEILQKHSPQTLLAVDAITALGAFPILMDDWKLDVVIGGSQKALMSPTGIGVIGLSQRAWDLSDKGSRLTRYYFDLSAEKQANQKKQTRFSSAVTLLTALDAALSIFERHGLTKIFSRTQNLSAATRAGFTELDFTLFPQTPSPSLSCMAVPPGVSAVRLRNELEAQKQITVMAGQDQLQDKVIRIGHMGYIRNENILALVRGTGECLQQLNPTAYPQSRIENAVAKTKSLLDSEIL